MERRILETIADRPWIWMQDLKLYFQLCDLRTRTTFTDPEFTGAVTNLAEQGLIDIGARLEMKGH
ncbi:hypothetical protein CAL7716_058030 [Calothrix sp. PCC 7716]|nr:hypothetical protein CAL7716_058030 [Calothrix sp. PCC 7716]